MDEKIYQIIFDMIQDYLPVQWKNLLFFASYTGGSYSMKFFVRTHDNNVVDCFKLPEVSKRILMTLFIDIDKILSKQRNELEKEKRWTVFVLKVDNSGKMKAEYDYDDHSVDMIEYQKKLINSYKMSK